MTTFVLVPGMCHGGWWYAPLVERLEAAGHRGLAVTPSGLGPDGLRGLVNLDTHVDDVLRAADDHDDLVLVGHSYGGMLISAVVDRIADRVAALVYLDAFVPRDGDSAYTTTNDDQRRWYVDGAAETGLAVAPLPFFDDRAQPHPLATLTQRLDLTGAWDTVPVKHHVEALQWPDDSPFVPTLERIRAEPGWALHRWDTRHNVMHDGPDRVLDLLLEVAAQL